MAERRQKKAFPGERVLSNERFHLGRSRRMMKPELPLSDAQGMSTLSGLKSCGPVQLLPFPNGEENARPNIGQGTNRYRMTLAFSSFALVIVSSPGFPSPTAVSKLEKRIASGLDASQTTMGLLVRSALVKDWRGARVSKAVRSSTDAQRAAWTVG